MEDNLKLTQEIMFTILCSSNRLALLLFFEHQVLAGYMCSQRSECGHRDCHHMASPNGIIIMPFVS